MMILGLKLWKMFGFLRWCFPGGFCGIGLKFWSHLLMDYFYRHVSRERLFLVCMVIEGVGVGWGLGLSVLTATSSDDLDRHPSLEHD